MTDNPSTQPASPYRYPRPCELALPSTNETHTTLEGRTEQVMHGLTSASQSTSLTSTLNQSDEDQLPHACTHSLGSETTLPALQAVVDCLREISTPPYLPNMLLSYLPSIHDAWTTGDIEDLHEPNTVQFIAVSEKSVVHVDSQSHSNFVTSLTVQSPTASARGGATRAEIPASEFISIPSPSLTVLLGNDVTHPIIQRETEQVAYGVKLTLQSTPPASALGPPDEYQLRRELALPRAAQQVVFDAIPVSPSLPTTFMLTQYDEIQPPREHIGIPGSHTALPALQAVVDSLRDVSAPPNLPTMSCPYPPPFHDAWTVGNARDLFRSNNGKLVAVSETPSMYASSSLHSEFVTSPTIQTSATLTRGGVTGTRAPASRFIPILSQSTVSLDNDVTHPIMQRETEQVACGVIPALQSTHPASALGPPDEYQFRRELHPVRLNVTRFTPERAAQLVVFDAIPLSPSPPTTFMLTQYDEIQPPREHIGIPGSHTALPPLQAVADPLRDFSTPSSLPAISSPYLPSLHDAWTADNPINLSRSNNEGLVAVSMTPIEYVSSSLHSDFVTSSTVQTPGSTLSAHEGDVSNRARLHTFGFSPTFPPSTRADFDHSGDYPLLTSLESSTFHDINVVSNSAVPLDEHIPQSTVHESDAVSFSQNMEGEHHSTFHEVAQSEPMPREDPPARSALTSTSRVQGSALTSSNPDENYLGLLNVSCGFCSALYFHQEANRVRGRYNLCCNFGNISLDHFPDFPNMIYSLYTGMNDSSRNFRKFIRSYNSALAMASMGAQIDTPRGNGPYCFRIHGQIYHYVGPLTPEAGTRPRFGQIYILDTDDAAIERIGNPANDGCDHFVMRELTRWMHANNLYARTFRMMGEVIRAEELRAQRLRIPLPSIRMIFDTSLNMDPRRYNIPAVNEVAVVFVGEDEDVPATRSFAVHHRRSGLQHILDIDKRCDPMTYPLFFPRGGSGWHTRMLKNPSQRSRSRISQREYYSHMLSLRSSFNPVHHAGKLLQQFVVDAYVKIEQSRLYYAKTHQKEFRIESYQGLMDHFASDTTDGPPGQRIVLPSSFQGGPRAMQQSYQDAMAIVARYGKPDYFLTFTCNPRWREIVENLSPGQTTSDRPDLVARVFHKKLDVLQTYLFKKNLLGRVAAHVGIVEWQKRGLPHCHMLLIMVADDKPRTAEQIDAAVQASLPDPSENLRLYTIVVTNMVHRRCGATNPRASCMVDGACSKRFPKDFRETTDTENDGYPRYKRPNDGRTVIIGGEEFDNRHIVPYNRYLLLLLNAHINLEVCGYVQAVKYLYKYVYKGPDRASLQMRQRNEDGAVDEIKAHLDARYVCAPEAIHHIFAFKSQYKSDSICRLQVHLPNFHSVTFLEGAEREALQAAAQRDTTLTAWFKLNLEYERAHDEGVALPGLIDARTLFYNQLPEHFTFDSSFRKWKPRGRGCRQIGRMYMVSPRDHERFSLRILLLHRKNMHSFPDLRTVDGVLHETFGEAARALDLLHDDASYGECLDEAAHFQMPIELRALFSYMLAFCDISDAQVLFDRFKGNMAEDFVHAGYSMVDAIALAYFDISDRLLILHCNISDRITAPADVRPELPAVEVNFEWHATRGRELYACLNGDQKDAADAILESLETDRHQLHFIDGPGGSGKTFLYSSLYHILKGRLKSVICVAWTGIAASLLPEGRTASSTFKLSMQSGNRVCNLKRGERQADPLKNADVIIWDEVSMVPKCALEAVDLLFQDLMCNVSPFGGKVFVLGGDFRQVLPIIERGTEADMIDACIKNSHLWGQFSSHRLNVNMRAGDSGNDWCTFLMDVGNGAAEQDLLGRVALPSQIISNGNLIGEVFGDQLTNTDSLSEKAILAPFNIEVSRINEQTLDRLPGQLREYMSVDDVVSDDVGDLEYSTEFLNSLSPAGLPPHNLRLKQGSIVMLLRNLDVANGLCNGTRLIVTHFGRLILGCRFASGERKGKFVLIPRIDNYTDKGVPFRLRRRQFPLRLAFAMTINKAQGQSLTHVGIHLQSEVFAHGQLYVALSRATSRAGVKVYTTNERVKNIVIKAVL